jgi:hypothetical protein
VSRGSLLARTLKKHYPVDQWGLLQCKTVCGMGLPYDLHTTQGNAATTRALMVDMGKNFGEKAAALVGEPIKLPDTSLDHRELSMVSTLAGLWVADSISGRPRDRQRNHSGAQLGEAPSMSRAVESGLGCCWQVRGSPSRHVWIRSTTNNTAATLQS